jgi:prolyl-tRNA synthetase
MKDLYTFDSTKEDALQTYDEVKQAYVDFFNEFKLEYLVAEADSGAMGGNLSHEFHFATPAGEDNVWSCDSCSYVANEELVERRIDSNEINLSLDQSASWLGLTQDKKSLVMVIVPQADLLDSTTVDISKLNSNNLKRALPSIDLSASDISSLLGNLDLASEVSSKTILNVMIDSRISALRSGIEPLLATITASLTTHNIPADFTKLAINLITTDSTTNKPLILNNPHPGSGCPRCATGTLKVTRAVELGHTFYLGTRYSAPLNALVEMPVTGGSPTSAGMSPRDSGAGDSPEAKDAVHTKPAHRVPVSMGCHGIGVSRLIGAIASVLSSSSGLNWPRCIAPYEVIIVPANPSLFEAAEAMQTILSRPFSNKLSGEVEELDVLLDDRQEVQVGYKLRDADLIGYPIIVVVGRGWKRGVLEVQCRRLGIKEEVEKEGVRGRVRELLAQL